MSNTANTAPSPTAAGFAGLLSALISPQGPNKSDPVWRDDELAEDIATLSYESALRSHSRYTVDAHEQQPIPVTETYQEAATYEAEPIRAAAAPAKDSAPAVEPAQRGFRPLERHLKNASITIRMSEEECTQLHQRANEAGMTVSAYLRSCTFEAEVLRAQVKETLAQLRLAATPDKSISTTKSASGRRTLLERLGLGFLARLFPHPQTGQRVARA
jgi:hypothetical protein